MSFDNNIVVIKLNTVDTPISFPSQETNCTQCHFKFRASANEAAANLFSFAAVIRVVTRHATLLPTKWGVSGEERCVTSDDPITAAKETTANPF